MRARPLLAFVLIAAALLVALRLVHLAVPIFYPRVLAGPFAVAELEEVEGYAGFEPLVPFYRPEVLGSGPVHVTVHRRPQPRVVVLWQGERFLLLAERKGGARPPVGPDARPLEGNPDARWWSEGRTRRAVVERDGLWIELRTDLPERDLHRLVDTLRPVSELR